MLQHLITQDADLRMVPVDHTQLTTAVNELRDELRSLPDGADPARTRLVSRWIGIGQVSLGDPHGALPFLRQSLGLAAAADNTPAVLATILNLGDAHRYAGEPETADALYRRALDTARREQPELTDFALQHYGKHLMEQGDLPRARDYLREALRLRIAKGDTGLIESTQAALDRVEILLTDASAADSGAPGLTEVEAKAVEWAMSAWRRRFAAALRAAAPMASAPGRSRCCARCPARWRG
ncbi:tetratricopeptide repeat protein [Kitasatospora sp. NPDC101801]|uniref:tetratricopeptide repeat protein n=1 Tax=Kitasatospora sp. NPDC101801 TaxID=3364103 RepID=UPI003806E1B6